MADGDSSDDTVRLVRSATEDAGFARVQVLENPRRRTSVGLNVALAAAVGEYVVRIDARSRVEPSYVRTCVQILRDRPEVGVVGGAQVATARTDRATDRAVARTLRNRWATGGSAYRRATRSGPSDTVWMGAFRTAELRDLQGWAEDVALNEDYELNQRYLARGAIVWFEMSLRSRYLPRPTVGRLGRQYFYFGRVKGMWWARGAAIGRRHQVLLAAPGVAVLGAIAVRRRFGWVPVLAGATIGAALIEVAGGDTEDDVGAVRLRATGLNVLVIGTWLAGVLVGYVGERLGVHHQHA